MGNWGYNPIIWVMILLYLTYNWRGFHYTGISLLSKIKAVPQMTEDPRQIMTNCKWPKTKPLLLWGTVFYCITPNTSYVVQANQSQNNRLCLKCDWQWKFMPLVLYWETTKKNSDFVGHTFNTTWCKVSIMNHCVQTKKNPSPTTNITPARL